LPTTTQVNVKFKYAANGRLQVSADIPSVDVQVRLDFERSSGLTDDEISTWTDRIKSGDLLVDADNDTGLPPEGNAEPASAASSPPSPAAGPPPSTREAKASGGPPPMPGAGTSSGPPPMPGGTSTGPPPMPDDKTGPPVVPARPAKKKRPPGPPPMPE
jgi:hypothetical protein